MFRAGELADELITWTPYHVQQNLLPEPHIHVQQNSLLEPHIHVQQNCNYPDAGYLDRLGPSDKSVAIATKLTCLETTGYRIKYSTVLWLLELQIRRGGKV